MLREIAAVALAVAVAACGIKGPLRPAPQTTPAPTDATGAPNAPGAPEDPAAPRKQ
jgi:predicted small lipoprotein YifL